MEDRRKDDNKIRQLIREEIAISNSDLERRLHASFYEQMVAFLPSAIARGISEAEKHMKPSQETEDRLKVLEANDNERNKALFGDDSNIGMVKKVDILYEKLIEQKGVFNFLKASLMIGGVSGMLWGLFKIIAK